MKNDFGFPDDAEIAHAYDCYIQRREQGCIVDPYKLKVGDRFGECIMVRPKGHHLVHITKCEAARRRELKRRLNVATSQERNRIVVQHEDD